MIARRNTLLITALSLCVAGCPKQEPAATTPTSLPGDAPEDSEATTDESVALAEAERVPPEEPEPEPPKVPELTACPANPKSPHTGKVVAPKADDLAAYLADCPGDGALYATFETSMGAIHCQLFADKTPMTVANFVGLARGLKPFRNPESGKVEQRRFFDGQRFHRVIPEFMIQGGCPLGTGTGNPGYTFDDEFDPSLRHDQPGTLSMANAGPGTNGSQFFITEVPTPHLDDKHTVFGRCLEVDVVKAIARVPKEPGSTSTPLKPVMLERVVISRAAP